MRKLYVRLLTVKLALAVTIFFCAAGPLWAAAAAAGADAPKAVDVNNVKNMDYKPFVTYIRQNGKPPVDYVVEKFKDHDVVMLGEVHEIKEYLAFYRELLEPLYRTAGVRVLTMEILKSKHNDELKRLVTAETYDRQAVLDIFRDEFRGIWGFKEYVDLVEAVWLLNSKLPSDAEKLVVVGLSTDMDILRPETQDFEAVDQNGADVISREALEKGKKALVPIGYNHTFLRYRQPKVEGGKLAGEMPPRLGCRLFEKYGERVFQVCMHLEHPDVSGGGGGGQASRGVLGGLVERVLRMSGGKAVGFDVVGSPFANLRDRKSYYFARQKKVVFSDIARGYIILKPFAELDRKMTWVDGFITDVNFAKARAFVLERGLVKQGKSITPRELDQLLKRVFEGN